MDPLTISPLTLAFILGGLTLVGIGMWWCYDEGINPFVIPLLPFAAIIWWLESRPLKRSKFKFKGYTYYLSLYQNAIQITVLLSWSRWGDTMGHSEQTDGTTPEEAVGASHNWAKRQIEKLVAYRESERKKIKELKSILPRDDLDFIDKLKGN